MAYEKNATFIVSGERCQTVQYWARLIAPVGVHLSAQITLDGIDY